MAIEKKYIPSTGITEEKVFLKPKCQAILSLIAHFQLNKKTIQRAHLIRALVKNADPRSLQKDIVTNVDKKMLKSEENLHNNRTITKKQNIDDKNLSEKNVTDRQQALTNITSKIMFNSIANLDKTVQQLRKLGLITNQYVRGYPRIILTHKGHLLFYSIVYPSIIFKMITELFNKLH